MIRCNNCGTNNLDGSEYCDECGMKLDLSAPPVSYGRPEQGAPLYHPPSAVQENSIPPEANVPSPLASNTQESFIPSPPSFTTSTSMPKPAMPARDARQAERREVDRRAGNEKPFAAAQGDKPAAYSNGGPEAQRSESVEPKASPQTYALSAKGRTDAFKPEEGQLSPGSADTVAKLVIERGGRLGREFSVNGIETSIGRWDADSGIFPDIDLDEDDPEAKISRRHARIIKHNGQFLIEDLGSTNGTFINRGRRLLPGKRHVLQHGDEVIIGKTFLKFQVLK
jgi:hypothetical protein